MHTAAPQDQRRLIYEPRLGPPPGANHVIAPADDMPWRNGMLVRTPNWLGDCMMAMPGVFRMRERMPSPCGLLVMCPAKLAEVWQAVPWVDAVVPLEGKRAGAAAVARIRAQKLGVGIVLPNSFGSAWDVRRCGQKVRLGRAGRGRGWLLTHRLPALPPPAGVADVHQVRHYLELAAAFGSVRWDAAYPPLHVENHTELAAKAGIASERTAWLVVAPGAAYGPAKQWPARNFRAVAQWWTANVGRVAAVGTGAERVIAEETVHGLDGALNLAGRTSLKELMAVLAASRCTLANDSGVMHLAAGLGRDGVAVFGSTDANATGPVGGRWIVLQGTADCVPCFQRTCARPEHDYRCLVQISPETVVDRIKTLLSSPKDREEAGESANLSAKGTDSID